MSQVMKCMCEECQFNNSFECSAESIEVQSDSGSKRVESADGTRCNTFTLRNR